MVKTHTINTLALLLTLLAQTLSSEGRAIKSPAMTITPQQSSNKPKLKNTTEKTSTSAPSFVFTTAMAHETEFRPTAPGTSPGAGHADISKYEKAESIHCSNDKCPEDFHPTAPGDSPGAGHSFVNNDRDTTGQGKNLGEAHTQVGQRDDYLPTAPGHSPGAGHPTTKDMRKTNS